MLSSLPALADEAEQTGPLKGIGLDGRLHHFAATPDCRAVAVVFLATHCPISNGTIPELKSLAAKYKLKGVEFYGVISDPAVNRAEAVKHRQEYHINFPVVFDASLNLRRQLKPTHTPQAIVLSPAGEVLYSGRIDDRYSAVNRKREVATQHDLEDALKGVIAGKPVGVPRTQPVGCLLEDPPEAAATGSVVFNRDIAPLMLSSCAECHRPGEAAPFSLLTYADVSAHANQIAAVTNSRVMPPWHPFEGYGRFRDERRLKDDEIALIQRWVADGKPEGDPRDRPAPPRFHHGWRLGQPDLILKMNEPFELSADGPDVHQHFVLPTGIMHNRLVSAVEFRPGNPRIVHHASFYVDNSGAARKLDEKDPSVGYGNFSGPGFENYCSFRSWLPGMSPQRLPRGTGTPVPAHSDVVLEIHYQRNGKVETDQSTVGIFFAESSAREVVMELQVMNKDLNIPPNEPRYRHVSTYTLPVTATLLDAAPHMHVLGREMKATVIL
ncbi:MAG TPA: redoxin family protein, partial [Planctomycetaceae bacterium]|nr:redoxin family protein [Planctomycetaceae bacterium]